MGAPRGTETTMLSGRAQSTLIGIVLLIGIVAIGSLGIFLVAGEAISGAEQQSEQEQVEQTFVSLSHGISTATVSDNVPHSLELEAGEHGAIAHHDSATYEIWSQDYTGENRTNISNGTIGTIEYESEDGTKIAYEGGGVFRETGERTQVVSAPSIDYDRNTYTLSFPVVTLTEEKTLSSGNIQLSQTSVDREPRNYVANDHVFVEIESEYCLGWEEYFAEQAGDMTVQQVCYGDENDDGKLKVRLGYADISNAFSSGASISDNDNYQTHQSGGEITDISDGNFKPLDNTIDSMVNRFDENESNITEEDLTDISGGKYFVRENSLDGTDEITFNLDNNDAIVVIQDDISGYDITVNSCGIDGEKQVKIYSTGDLDLDNNRFEQNCGDDESNLQIYGTSEMAIDFGNGYIQGLLYAASDKDPSGDFDGWLVHSSGDKNYQIDLQGSPEFDGSIVAHSISEGSNFNDFNANGLEDNEVDVIPEGYEPAPQLTYLNLAKHEIDIKDD